MQAAIDTQDMIYDRSWGGTVALARSWGARRRQAFGTRLTALAIASLVVVATGGVARSAAAALGNGQILRSPDWKPLPFHLATNIQSVYVDPAAHRTVYIAANGGLFRTTDAGQTWRGLNKGLPTRSIASIAADHAAHVLYAGTLGCSVFERPLA